MEYRYLGNTQVRVSALCLGTMTFGEQNTETEAHAQLSYAVERGINFIDTAEMYSIPPRAETQGRTETYIGTWLKGRPDREHLVIATKAAGPGATLGYLRGGPNFGAKHLRQATEDSLRRLQTEYIDLYQLHWPERQTNFFGKRGFRMKENDVWTDFRQVLETLDTLRQEGKIRYVGLSNETPWGAMKFLELAQRYDLPRMQTIQNPYSLVNRQFEVGLAEIALREELGLLAYSPMAMGTLSGKYLGGAQPAGARLTRWKQYTRYNSGSCALATQAYVDLARLYGLQPAQMALAFVTQQPFVTANIIGATTMEQLQENIDSSQVRLSDELLQRIEAIHEQYPDPAT